MTSQADIRLDGRYFLTNVDHLSWGFNLGDENQVGSFGNDLLQVFEPQRKLVDAHHALTL